jgi:hypothetical protein
MTDAGMNDVLPKPFTKDSLLGMLEKHLLHMKQMQQMQQGYPVRPALKSQRLVELPEDQQQSSAPSAQAPQPTTSITDSLNIEDPNLQFSYDHNYSAIFGPSMSTAPPPPPSTGYPQQSPTSSNGKRRQPIGQDLYEYLDQPQTVPRSSGVHEGQTSGKRARYNTPPW